MIFYHPDCDLKFSEYGIEIPIKDDRALKVFQHLQSHHPKLTFIEIKEIPEITFSDLLLAHNSNYINKLLGSYKELEVEMLSCFELIDSQGHFNRYNPHTAALDFRHALGVILKQVGMTYWAAKLSLSSGFSYFLGGGMHHAMSFGGRGFCLLNDIVIAIRKLQNDKLIQTAWIIDVDAHKGDGSAEITKDDQSIITLSLHMKSGWPLDSGVSSDPWFIPSDIDIEIDSLEEDFYLEKLMIGLNELEKNYQRPDIVIIVNGADPYELDELPSTAKIKLSKEQLFLRDKILYHFFKYRHIPQSYVMAGGYGEKSWEIYSQFLEFVGQDSSKRSEISSR